jgi:hypothetical protein
MQRPALAGRRHREPIAQHTFRATFVNALAKLLSLGATNHATPVEEPLRKPTQSSRFAGKRISAFHCLSEFQTGYFRGSSRFGFSG